MATALMYTIVSDVVEEAGRYGAPAIREVRSLEKANIESILCVRATVFFQITATAITSQFVGPLASAGLMTWSPWIPMLLGLGIELASLIVLVFIPETIDLRRSAPVSSPASPPDDRTRVESSRWNRLVNHVQSFPSRLPSNYRVILISCTFLVHMLLLNRDVLLQYISTRYGISLAESTTLISIRSGLVVLLSVAVLPLVNTYCRRRLSTQQSDMLLARTSALIMALSFLGVGFAPRLPLLVASLVVNALGWGFWSFLRSLTTSLVEVKNLARLNTLIGVFDTVGLMIGSPVLAALFAKAIEFEGPWFGFPFIVCSGVIGLLALVLFAIRA